MSFWYNKAKTLLAKGDLDLDVNSIRIILVMGNSTVLSEPNTEFVDDFTTLDEYDGTNYARKILGSQAVTEQLANDRTYFTSSGVTWAALGNGTRTAIAMVIYKHVNNDADSPVLAVIDDPAIFPFNGGDQNVSIDPATVPGEEGWLDFE